MKSTTESTLPQNPNFIILMTDQQRSLQYFPDEWIKKYLPNYQYFLDNGVVFKNNICNTSPCGPSRASIFSGLYPATNQITGNVETLNPDLMNFTKILNQVGYKVYYKGKFHMAEDSTDFSKTWTQDLLTASDKAKQDDSAVEKAYGFQKWTSPDFGTNLVSGASPGSGALATLAAGIGGNDNRVVTGEGMLYPEQQSALEFLNWIQSEENPDKDVPFCLVVSLLNPHDISLYPTGYTASGYQNAVFESFPDFQLPASYADTLDFKPTAQAAYLNGSFGGKLDSVHALNYLKFYAYLHTLSDRLHQTVLDAVSDNLLQKTVIIRAADHGEMGMSHGGQQEKNFNIYEETTKVPMIWYHPSFQKGTRNQMVSMLDLIPTLADFTDASTLPIQYTIKPQGTSFKGLLFDERAAFPSSSLFNYNGTSIGYTAPESPGSTDPSDPTYTPNPNVPSGTPAGKYPANIYAILTEDNLKYAVYYNMVKGAVDWTTVQYEMYDLNNDLSEMTNLLPVGASPSTEGLKYWASLHDQLTQKLDELGIKPNGWQNPIVQ